MDGNCYNRTSTGSAAAIAQKLGVPRRLPGGGATEVCFWRMNRSFSGLVRGVEERKVQVAKVDAA